MSKKKFWFKVQLWLKYLFNRLDEFILVESLEEHNSLQLS